MLNEVNLRILEFKSPEQIESIELRRKVLREPLGLDFKSEDLEKERDQMHLAAYTNDTLRAILLLVKYPEEGRLRMRQVAVDTEFQGSGIGRKLVAFSEQWAIQNNYKRIELHARSSVLPFYLKMDYQIKGEEFLEVGIPHREMFKQLIP